jgi:hypothetical protein
VGPGPSQVTPAKGDRAPRPATANRYDSWQLKLGETVRGAGDRNRRPLYVLATNRAAFRPVKHVLIPLTGSAVLVYEVYELVQPSQPPLANVLWARILGIVLVAAVATVIVYLRRPGAPQKAVTSGPEYIVPEAPGR